MKALEITPEFFEEKDSLEKVKQIIKECLDETVTDWDELGGLVKALSKLLAVRELVEFKNLLKDFNNELEKFAGEKEGKK